MAVKISSTSVVFSLFVSFFFVLSLNLSETQGQLNVLCPSRAAQGSIKAGQLQVILHSPKNQRDIQINYDGNDWTESKTLLSKSAFSKQGFNASNPLVVYVHAYMQSANSDWLQEVRSQYDQEHGDQFNLALLDWSYFSRQRYDTSASWAPKLGELLGKFLAELETRIQRSDLIERTHLVAYSLGTHIAGLAGRYLQANGRKSLLGRITALDPTGVCFHQKDSQFASQYSLKPTDARLVVARHFDMGTLGSSRPTGGVDVFVNGGKNQPTPSRAGSGVAALWPLARAVGLRAPSHMIASWNEVQPQIDDCRSVAYSCPSYRLFLEGECADCGDRRQNAKCIDLNSMDATRDMGRASGAASSRYKLGTSMFIKTTQDSGCIYHYQAILRLKRAETSQAQKKLLEDSLSFVFVSSSDEQSRNQRARIDHQLDDGISYTALLTTDNGRLAKSNKVQMQLAQGKGEEQMVELANLIETLELNYMSHIEQSERLKKSAKFCISSKSRGVLRKC